MHNMVRGLVALVIAGMPVAALAGSPAYIQQLDTTPFRMPSASSFSSMDLLSSFETSFAAVQGLSMLAPVNGNLSILSQSGEGNLGSIVQDGTGNIGYILQSGSYNTASITQTGNNHVGVVMQQGSGNVAILRQR